MKGYKHYVAVNRWVTNGPHSAALKKWVTRLFGGLGRTFTFVLKDDTDQAVYYHILTKKDPYPVARLMIRDGFIQDIWPVKK